MNAGARSSPAPGYSLLVALGLLFWTGGCSEKGPYYGRLVPRHGPLELWANLGSEPEYLDPAKASDNNAGFMIRNTFAGLVQIHPQTLAPMPDIARRWEVSEGGRVYTFELRESTWSDGHPLDARDFEYSLKRVLNPSTASKYASFLYSLRNGAAYNQKALWIRGQHLATETATLAAQLQDNLRGQISEVLGPSADGIIARLELSDWPEPAAFLFVDAGSSKETASWRQTAIQALDGSTLAGGRVQVAVADESVVGVRSVDSYTLECRLKDPLPYFLKQLSFYTARPQPRHHIERLKKEGINPDLWTRPERWVSNGAYVISESKFRQYYVLEKNPKYWDADRVRLSKIKLLLVESYNTTLNLYRTADIDWIGETSTLPSEFKDSLRTYKDFVANPYLAVYWYWVNTKAPPLDDVRIRKALSLAVDRASLVEHITRGGELPMPAFVPDGLGGYKAPNYVVHDPEKARELLAEAGYPGGTGMPKVTLSYNTSEGHKQLAEAIHQMWKSELGIDVEIENQEWKVYLKNLQLMNFQLGRMGWIGDFADPFTFLEVFSKYNGNNHSNWSSESFDRLLETANSQADPDRRLSILKEAEQILVEEVPAIPIYVYSRTELLKPYLRGYWGNLRNYHPLKWMYIDERFYDKQPEDVRVEDPPPPMIEME